jgi:arsenate reductase-like glutaredoxin family protein
MDHSAATKPSSDHTTTARGKGIACGRDTVPAKKGLGAKKAIALMLAHPSAIKRPVLDVGGKLVVGFKPEPYAKAFGVRGARAPAPRS